MDIPGQGNQNRTNETFDFDKAIADIRKAAEVLTKPHAKETLQAVQDAVKAVAAVQDALKAVPLPDAVKAIAIQDAVKAVAVSDAVKGVVPVSPEMKDVIRTVVSEEIARAVDMIRSAAAAASKKE